MNPEEGKDSGAATGEHLFICSYPGCGRTFRTKFSCKRHSYTHTNEKSFVCMYCGRKFTLQQHLKEHIYRHTKNKPYVCGVAGCRKSFRHASELSLHRRTHPEYKLRKYHFTAPKTSEPRSEPQSPEMAALQSPLKVESGHCPSPIAGVLASHAASTDAHSEANVLHEQEGKPEEEEGLDTTFLEYLLALGATRLPTSRPILPIPRCFRLDVLRRSPACVN